MSLPNWLEVTGVERDVRSAAGSVVHGPVDRELRLVPGEYVMPSGILDLYFEALKAVPGVGRRRLRDGEWIEDSGGET